MSGSSSSSKSFALKFDKQFREIQGIATSLLKESLGATLNQQQFQTALFGLLQPEFERLTAEHDLVDSLGSPEARQQLLRDSIDRNNRLTDQASLLSDQLSASASNLGTLTDTDRELISSVIGSARDVGQQQIDQFVAGNFRNANEVAAARGFRPGDAPIGNIRGRVAEEAITQKGLLESQLAGQAAGLAIDLPNQRTALLGSLAGQQTGLAQAGQQFQASLAQNAEANRLNLTQSVGQLGLGLASTSGAAAGVLGASRPAVGVNSKSAQGGLSTMHLKRNARDVDPAEVLERLQGLPIEAWQYIWDHPDQDGFRIGPYAEHFADAFGGNGYTIDYLSALGVSMVALKEVARRIERIEEVIGLKVVDARDSEVIVELA